MARVATGLKEGSDEGRRRREDRLNYWANEYLKDGGLWRLSADGAAQWAGELRRICEALNRTAGPINKTAKSLSEVSAHIPDLIKSLTIFEIGAAQPLPTLPSTAVATEFIANHRIAWLKLILTSLILAAIMTVNTVMLSQILKDLGVIPPALSFVGIALAYVVAFLMTSIEAGLGVGHAATRIRGSEKFSVWPTFFSFLAFLLSLVEGFFWSRIAPTQGTLTLPFVNYEMSQQSLFFCFGFALVWTLFGLGSVGFEAFAEVLTGRRDELLNGALKNLRRLHDEYSSATQTAQKLKEQVLKDASALDKSIEGPVANAQSVLELLEKLRLEIEERAKVEPAWARREDRQLIRTEVYHLSQMAGAWMFLGACGSIALTVVTLASISRELPDHSAWSVAIIPAVTFFGIGLALGTRETVVRGGPERNERRVVVGPQLFRWAIYSIGGLLSGFYLTVAVVRSPLVIVDLIMGLFVAFAAYQLGPLLGVSQLFLGRLWNLIVSVASAASFGFFRAIQFLVTLLEYTVYLFAAPLERLLGKRKQDLPAELMKARSAQQSP